MFETEESRLRCEDGVDDERSGKLTFCRILPLAHLVCCGKQLRTFDPSQLYTTKLFDFPTNTTASSTIFTMTSLKRKSPEFINAPDATPRGPPAKKLRLTQTQKQALMDNLQLESAWE
jgi:hypothetical protein